nr:hypothetical protein [Tanacetum cinerariifolium]
MVQKPKLYTKVKSDFGQPVQADDEEVDWIDSDEDEVKKDDTYDDKSIDLEKTNDEETKDEFVQCDEQADVEKAEEVKDDAKKAELPSTSSNLSVSLGFADQFLKLSSDTSLFSTIKDTTDTKINSLLEIKIQYEVPQIHSTSVLRVPVSVISEPSVLTPVQETPSLAPVTTLPPLSVSTIPPVPYKTKAPIHAPPVKPQKNHNAVEYHYECYFIA